MSLDTSGILLEGARYSTGNSGYTFPPDRAVSDASALASMTERSEYLVVAGSSNPSKGSFDVADPDLVFFWSKNEPYVTRFDYDNFSGRWLPMPGTSPRLVGSLSNSTRISIPVPNQGKSGSAPFDLYVDKSPRVSFSLIFVGSSPFSNPTLLAPLTAEINSSGQINFSAADIATYGGQSVMFTGQSFFLRTQNKGNIGTLPDVASSDYRIFMNPRPATGQLPQIRIGYGQYLQPEEVASESLLLPPPAGYVRWSSDTGRLKFAAADILAHPEETVYYDGVFLGSSSFSRTTGIVVSSGWPSSSMNIPSAAGCTDLSRFAIFAEKTGDSRRYFLPSVLFKSSEGFPGAAPSPGYFYLDADTGNVYLSVSDVLLFSGWQFGYVDTLLMIGAPGVGLKMKRSGANGPGLSLVADFMVVYAVSQLITDNISMAPFVMLPTVPIVNSSLKLAVEMGTGQYVGTLADASDPAKMGFGYILDLDAKRMKFSSRSSSSITLAKNQASIKLDSPALYGKGIEVKRNGAILSASDFDLDASAGMIEFVEPVGEGESETIESVGSANGSVFTSFSPIFSEGDIGKRLLIVSGSNSGIRNIVSVESDVSITVEPAFVANENATASVRATDETIADRIWTPLSSTPRKFSLYRSQTGLLGPFEKVAVGKYAVKSNVGQVNVSDPALPGESFKIEYVSLDTADDGSTVSTSRTEFASFKIGQEIPTFSVGSRVIQFNSAGRTINLDKPVLVYVQGVTYDSTNFVFSAPGTITMKDPIPSGPVTMDYWVEEASGGESVFDLSYSPIDYDSLKISGPTPSSPGQQAIDVSGDQTGTLKAGGAVLIGDKDVLYIVKSFYDSGVTHVSFAQAAVADGESIKAVDTINTSFPGSSQSIQYLVAETSAVEIFVAGTGAVKIHGDKRQQYRPGTVIDFDGDPYWVVGCTYDPTSGVTQVSTAGTARRNYISPVVKRSIRPVLNPSVEFSTSKPAYISRGFILARMGQSNSILAEGVDYDLGDDGVIRLKVSMSFGDSLRAMYVARDMQPAGTVFEFNFAHEIAPSDGNGLARQRLRMDYDLYAPDTFFYRVETVVSMLPEAKDAASGGSTTGSGPNIASVPSRQTKDAGLPSPWYDSMHYQNLDIVVQRFLKFYHDVIETYEDLLSLIDGRIVGGDSGRFRYDGNTENPPVDSYWQIKNDIDDRIKLYDAISMGPGFPPSAVLTPVYGRMSDPNNMSRLFPMLASGRSFTVSTSSFTEANNGQQVGSFDISNILSVGTTVTSRSSSFFTASAPIPGGTKFHLDSSSDAVELSKILYGGSSSSGTNGSQDALIPPFVVGQKIQVFDLDGSLDSSGAITGVDALSPYIVYTDITTSLSMGSIVQTQADFGGDANMQNLYAPGMDYLYSSDNGKIMYFKLPASFPAQNNPLVGNEVVEAPISFGNSSTSPSRIPALDGKEMNDSGWLSIPRKRHMCELRFLLNELSLLRVGLGACYGGHDVTVLGMQGPPAKVGETIQFVNGPNHSVVFNVVGLLPGNILRVSPSPLNIDLSGSSFVVGNFIEYNAVLADEIQTANSELSKLDSAVLNLGDVELSSISGSASSSTVWTDLSSDLSGFSGKILWIRSGANRGVYKIDSASAHSVTIGSEYPPLVGGPGSYSIIGPVAFVQESEFLFISSFFRNTRIFLEATQLWQASFAYSAANARQSTVKQRQSDLSAVAGPSGSLTSLLENGDNLYDMRFLWIDQRTNKESGMVQLQARAAIQAEDTLAKVSESQRKAYVMSLIE